RAARTAVAAITAQCSGQPGEHAVLDAAARLVAFDHGLLLRCRPNGAVAMLAASGRDASPAEAPADAIVELARLASASGQPLLDMGEAGTSSAPVSRLAMPCAVAGRMRAVLVVERAGRNPFTVRDRALLERFAHFLDQPGTDA